MGQMVVRDCKMCFDKSLELIQQGSVIHQEVIKMFVSPSNDHGRHFRADVDDLLDVIILNLFLICNMLRRGNLIPVNQSLQKPTRFCEGVVTGEKYPLEVWVKRSVMCEKADKSLE
eukprot:Lithocolla_globosa_v1_NODE_1784_length_2342_cov_5.841277.p2 type:complete len:116 gc:universal NODE_1784_length_2342_cov_5.841277:550-897(+)